MSDSSHAPTGYCPKCGYRMDPGTCSECGLAITAATLATRPPHVRRRRRRIVLVLVALVIGGYTAYRQIDWIPLLPNRVLFALHGDVTDAMTCELLTRHAAGGLPIASSDRLFHSLLKPVQFDVRSPYPVGYELKPVVRIEVLTWKPDPNLVQFRYNSEDWTLEVDGAVVLNSVSLSGTGPILIQPVLPGVVGLKPGTHEIRVSGAFVVTTTSPPASHALSINITKQVVIEDRPIGDYVNLVWSDDTARAMMVSSNCAALAVLYPGVVPNGRSRKEARRLDFYFERPEVPVAGRVLIRASGDSSFEELQSGSVLARRAVNSRYGGAWFGGLENATAVDVKLVPDIESALKAGFSECFAGVLQWDDLPLLKEADFRDGFPGKAARDPSKIERYRPN